MKPDFTNRIAFYNYLESCKSKMGLGFIYAMLKAENAGDHLKYPVEIGAKEVKIIINDFLNNQEKPKALPGQPTLF